MALPDDFVRQIEEYSAPELDGLIEALNAPASVSVRVNPRKFAVPEGFARVPWCENGIYLPDRPKFTFDPLMHQGAYYVQDASSMIMHHIVRHITRDGCPRRYLDACAAPGGKTGAAVDALPAGSVVVANEYVRQRAAILRENITKWGAPMVCAVNFDTSAFSEHPGLFDIVAADVPCSGEGMMRKDEEAARQWSRALVGQCVERQREIVDNLFPALRPGGYFIYSTCTFNRDENEEMVEYIMRRYGCESVPVPMDDAWGIAGGLSTDAACYRFVPGRVLGEGLFVAVLRKPEGSAPARNEKSRREKRKGAGRPRPETETVGRWLDLPEGFTLESDGQRVHTVMTGAGLPDALTPRVEVASVKGRDVLPSQALAMSTMLRRGVFAEAEVGLADALRYLHREALTVDGARGLLLLTYSGLPLGFVKNLGNRANNMYPSEWRILTNPDYSSLPPGPLTKNH